MVCCSSAPPITGMRERDNIGQVVGARKHTRGRRPAGASGGGAVAASGRASAGLSAKVALIDSLHLAGCIFDAGVLAHPLFLLGHDLLAVAVGPDDRAR